MVSKGRKMGRLVAGLGAAVGLVAAAPAASAEQIATWNLAGTPGCNQGGWYVLPDAHVGDTFVIQGAGAQGLNCETRWVAGDPFTLDASGVDIVYTFTNPAVGAEFTMDWTTGTTYFEVNIAALPEVPAEPVPGPAAIFTLTLVPGEGATCTVTTLSGRGGSWVRLPSTSACVKPGATLAGWEARSTDGHATTVHAAYESLHLTGDNTLYAMWVPNPQPKPKDTRWVIWQWDAKTGKAKPVSADLIGTRPVVTIHAPKASAVSAAMVKAAEQLVAKHGGTYAGIMTATKWKSPRIVTAYTR